MIDYNEKIGGAERRDVEVLSEEDALKAINDGLMGIMKPFQFIPNREACKDLSDKQIENIAREELDRQLDRYCASIKWWPDSNREKYVFRKMADGSFALFAYLVPSKTEASKGISEFGKDEIGVDMR